MGAMTSPGSSICLSLRPRMRLDSAAPASERSLRPAAVSGPASTVVPVAAAAGREQAGGVGIVSMQNHQPPC